MKFYRCRDTNYKAPSPSYLYNGYYPHTWLHDLYMDMRLRYFVLWEIVAAKCIWCKNVISNIRMVLLKTKCETDIIFSCFLWLILFLPLTIMLVHNSNKMQLYVTLTSSQVRVNLSWEQFTNIFYIHTSLSILVQVMDVWSHYQMTSCLFDTQDKTCLVCILIEEKEIENVVWELLPFCSNSNVLALGWDIFVNGLVSPICFKIYL